MCDSLSSEWSIKKPSDMVNVLYKSRMLNAARKTPGKSVEVQTGCGADDIAAKEESDDDDADAGGGSGRSSAMEEAGACTHPVGACPSSSAGAQLGSLNAADPPLPEPHEDLVELDALDLVPRPRRLATSSACSSHWWRPRRR